MIEIQRGAKSAFTKPLPARDTKPASGKSLSRRGAKSASAKPLPPTVFVLTTGERLEARHYVLTGDNLYVTTDRQQRTIPRASLEPDATVNANRQRGIDLQFFSHSDAVSVSF